MLVEHGLVLSAYALLAIALTWPLVRDFQTRPIGHVLEDMRHATWSVWYVKEALLGQVTWPYTRLLHYPYGMSVLADGVGPLNGILALPFWPWGSVAAFNGSALLGVTLSGWCLYLLARYVGMSRGAALFAGALFMAWPIHLAGLYGHLEKAFVGLLPLVLLAGLAAFDLQRRWSIFTPGPVLVLLALQNGNQFTFGVLALAILALLQLARAPRAVWLPELRRVALVAVVSIAICTPLLDLILRSAYHPWIDVEYSDAQPYYSPDLLQFFVPSIHQIVPGRWVYPDRTVQYDWTLTSSVPSLNLEPGRWYGSGIETAVAIPITALVLAIAGCWTAERREVRRWLIFGVVFAILALGPYLRVAGQTTFFSSQVQIPLPTSWLSQWPGFNIMRTPGRFMMMGSVGFAMAAGFGFMALSRRWPTHRVSGAAALAVALLAMVECWPAAWPQRLPPPIPKFYQRLARDRAMYGVLDLPHGWLGYSARATAYHSYQMTHGKGIAWANLSRFYTRYPMLGFDSLWNPNARNWVATRRRLEKLGYRYVVWHKYADELFGRTSVDAVGPRGPAVSADTHPFLHFAFEGERPIEDDELVTVFLVAPSPRENAIRP